MMASRLILWLKASICVLSLPVEEGRGLELISLILIFSHPSLFCLKTFFKVEKLYKETTFMCTQYSHVTSHPKTVKAGNGWRKRMTCESQKEDGT